MASGGIQFNGVYVGSEMVNLSIQNPACIPHSSSNRMSFRFEAQGTDRLFIHACLQLAGPTP